MLNKSLIKGSVHSLSVALLVSLASASAYAKVDADDASKLGSELTPIGATAAGNDVKEPAWKRIPAWDGGVTEAPPGFVEGESLPTPFPGEKPLLTITADNYEEFDDYLTEGHKALFRTYPDTWKMPVYTAHRSAAYQDWVYEATIENATKVEMVNDGNGIKGTAAGYPFAIPQSGREVMWNHQLRNRGVDGIKFFSASAVVQRDGKYEISKTEGKVLLYYNNRNYDEKSLKNRFVDIIVKAVAPQRKRGEGYLLNINIDRVKEPPKVWFYSPGLRRTKVFESPDYDNPVPDSDNLVTIDQIDMFNGPMDRYDFDYKGVEEMLIPYNAYQLFDRNLKYEDILKAGHPNTELQRYEMHRVHVVEAKVKDEFEHIYKKRVFYIDEDTWEIMAQDIYDQQDQFWRYAETHPVVYYQIPTFGGAAQFHYDLQSRQYFASGISNEEPPAEFIVPKEKEFTLGAFKREMR